MLTGLAVSAGEILVTPGVSQDSSRALDAAERRQDAVVHSDRDKKPLSTIIVQPGTVPATSNNVNKAREYIRDNGSAPVPTSPTIILVPEDDVMAPRGVGQPPDNRSKARDYIRDNGPSGHSPGVILLEKPAGNAESSRSNLDRTMNKARSYTDKNHVGGSKPGTTVQYGSAVGVVGADGVIVFACGDINNSAGRIGDDSQSGNLLSVVINGKLVPARCR